MPALTRDELLRLRCTDEDWRVWQMRARVDELWRGTDVHRRRVDRAREALLDFVRGERGYIGISWGKDSTALLSLVIEIECDWPLVHIALDPVANPHCDDLRDAWFAIYPSLRERYFELRVRCKTKASTHRYDTDNAYVAGFRASSKRFGSRYVTGIRAEESGIRKRTVRARGLGREHSNSGRPLGYWTSEDVYARLTEFPLHPNYPCTVGGAVERGRVRVDNLWESYGEEYGRHEWELKYYRDTLRKIERQHAQDLLSPPTREECRPRWTDPQT